MGSGQCVSHELHTVVRMMVVCPHAADAVMHALPPQSKVTCPHVLVRISWRYELEKDD